MIIAHRGYAKKASENTIEAFEDAFKHGADAIETDVRLTKDGEVVVSHDDKVDLSGNRITISKISSIDVKDFLNLDQLFDYIKSKQAPFFLELKSSSFILFEKIVKKISDNNLWERVYLFGFSSMIKTALKHQAKYPKLRICQIIMIPHLCFVKKPKKSYAIFFGWLDGIRYSEKLVRTMTTSNIIVKFRKMYEAQGFKVMAGVFNREDGIKYFQNAGICDIFTDEVETAAKILKS